MLVIFEGPNGAGKTTLLRSVWLRFQELRHERRFNVQVLRHVPKPAAPATWPHAETTEATYGALRCCDFSQVDVLVDRLWVSDAVHASTFGRPPYDRSYVRPRRDFRYVAVVYVTVDDWTVLRERCRHGVGTQEHASLERLHRAFETYFGNVPAEEACEVVRVRTDVGSSPDVLACFVAQQLVDVERRIGGTL